jgi:hypothetical protein
MVQQQSNVGLIIRRSNEIITPALVFHTRHCSIFFGACGPPTFSVSDYTWEDENMNGIQDEGEGPLSNVKVELYSADKSQQQATTSSDKDGIYRFDSLAAGDYRLKFTPPLDYVITQKDAGDDDTEDSDPFPAGNDAGWTEIVSIKSENINHVDAGFFTSGPAATPTPTPEGVIQSPTGQPITATPVQASGDAVVKLTVVYDDAGHKIFVALEDTSNVGTEIAEGMAALTFKSANGATEITLSGPIDENGNADLSGSGLVAGFPDVSGTFVGTVEVAPDGSIVVNGELTLGANGELPQGEPIIYEASS